MIKEGVFILKGGGGVTMDVARCCRRPGLPTPPTHRHTRTGCTYAAVERVNRDVVKPLLEELTRTPFFRYFKVCLLFVRVCVCV